ncbi:hypothetical protein SPHV1_2290071 [Novosphingobium sp. KN65.2]|nr:hypothetical protein SPHV1_2290071 [Novosphingobium sp. KN65.2]
MRMTDGWMRWPTISRCVWRIAIERHRQGHGGASNWRELTRLARFAAAIDLRLASFPNRFSRFHASAG